MPNPTSEAPLRLLRRIIESINDADVQILLNHCATYEPFATRHDQDVFNQHVTFALKAGYFWLDLARDVERLSSFFVETSPTNNESTKLLQTYAAMICLNATVEGTVSANLQPMMLHHFCRAVVATNDPAMWTDALAYVTAITERCIAPSVRAASIVIASQVMLYHLEVVSEQKEARRGLPLSAMTDSVRTVQREAQSLVDAQSLE